MELLQHPFRLTGGAAATATDGSDAALADAVVRLCLTRPGELELVPAYGIPDPVWADPTAGEAGAVSCSVDVARLNACLATFGPAATVTLAGVVTDARVQRVSLEVTAS